MNTRRWWNLCHLVLAIGTSFGAGVVFQSVFRGATSGVFQVVLNLFMVGFINAARYALKVSFRWARSGIWTPCSCFRMLVPLTYDKCLQCIFELRVTLGAGGGRFTFGAKPRSTHFIWGGRHIVEVAVPGTGDAPQATPAASARRNSSLGGLGEAERYRVFAGPLEGLTPLHAAQGAADGGGGKAGRSKTPVKDAPSAPGMPGRPPRMGGVSSAASTMVDDSMATDATSSLPVNPSASLTSGSLAVEHISSPHNPLEGGGAATPARSITPQPWADEERVVTDLTVDTSVPVEGGTGTDSGPVVLPTDSSDQDSAEEEEEEEEEGVLQYVWLSLFVNEGQERLSAMFLALLLEMFTAFALTDILSPTVFVFLLLWQAARILGGHGTRWLVSAQHERWPLQRCARSLPCGGGLMRWFLARVSVDRISSIDVRVAYYKVALLTFQLQPERRSLLANVMTGAAAAEAGRTTSGSLSGTDWATSPARRPSRLASDALSEISAGTAVLTGLGVDSATEDDEGVIGSVTLDLEAGRGIAFAAAASSHHSTLAHTASGDAPPASLHPAALRVPRLGRTTDAAIRQMLILRSAQDSMLQFAAVVLGYTLFLVCLAIDAGPTWGDRYQLVPFRQAQQVSQGLLYGVVQLCVMTGCFLVVCWGMHAYRGIKAGMLWVGLMSHPRTFTSMVVFVWLLCVYLNAFYGRQPLQEEQEG